MREHAAIPDLHRSQFSKPDRASDIWTFLTQRSPQPSEGEIHVKKRRKQTNKLQYSNDHTTTPNYVWWQQRR